MHIDCLMLYSVLILYKVWFHFHDRSGVALLFTNIFMDSHVQCNVVVNGIPVLPNKANLHVAKVNSDL